MSNKKKIFMKRILSDINDIIVDPVEGIYISYDEDNLKTIRALIIGPEGTPYEDGAYFFTLQFPEKYPFTHPTAKFETINQQIRFNPNLYEGGKVCLSILGTWSGPKWTSVQTIKSVLLSIQSLMSENPIVNEPGHETSKKTDEKSKEYIEYVRFHNYSFALLHMINNKSFFPYFNDVLKQHFLKNYNKFIQQFKKLQHLDNKTVHTPIWGKSVTINYSKLMKDYEETFLSIQ